MVVITIFVAGEAYIAICGAGSQGCRGDEAEGGGGAGGGEPRLGAEEVGTEVGRIRCPEDLCHLRTDSHQERAGGMHKIEQRNDYNNTCIWVKVNGEPTYEQAKPRNEF